MPVHICSETPAHITFAYGVYRHHASRSSTTVNKLAIQDSSCPSYLRSCPCYWGTLELQSCIQDMHAKLLAAAAEPCCGSNGTSGELLSGRNAFSA